MFDYTPMTEEDSLAQRYQMLTEGEYNGVISSAHHSISKSSGNNMIELTVDIFDLGGNVTQIKDYLPFTDKMMWKVIKCVKSAGIHAQYANKSLEPEHFLNKNVRVKVKFQPGDLVPLDRLNGKEVGTKYPDKNVIADYLAQGPVTKKIQETVLKKDEFDPDIPF